MKTFTKSNGFYRSIVLLLICALMMTNKSQAQYSEPLPPATSCTSKDLELASASLSDGINFCNTASGARTVYLGINNKTGSTRTAFAAWATLKRYDAHYNLIKDSLVFFCANTIEPNINKKYPAEETIYYNSGENLVLSNIFLAWTSANKNENCAYLKANPSKISPKCGTQDSTQLYAGVGANIVAQGASCPTGTGSISVTPFGGKIPYAVKVTLTSTINGAITTKQAGQGQTVVFDVTPGTYAVRVDDANGCFKDSSGIKIDNPPVLASPLATAQAPTCNILPGLVTVTTFTPGYTYKLTGTTNYTTTTSTFTGVKTGTYKLSSTSGVCADTSTTSVVTVADTLDVPAAPQVCTSVNLDFCNIYLSTLTVKVDTSSLKNLSNYKFSNNGTTFSSIPQFSINFGDSATKSYYIQDVTSGCISSATSGCYATACPATVTPLSAEVKGSAITTAAMMAENSRINNLGSGDIEAAVTVKPIPNPFKNQVRFLINTPTSGNGSLDIFNIQGQKIKTLYQGYIPAGANFFDLTVPVQRQGDLIYIFTQGNTRLSGKLIQINGHNRN